MVKMSSLVFWLICILPCHSGRTYASCSSSQISCRSGKQCIDLSHVCRGGMQCSDGSDEDPVICSFWQYDDEDCESGEFHSQVHFHSPDQFYDSDNWECLSVYQFYQQNRCFEKDERICELIKKGKLQLTPKPETKPVEPPEMALNDEIVSLLQQAVNISSMKYPSSPCPMLYSKVGDLCLSFFSPAKIPWAEASQFCLSMMGDLLHVTDIKSFGDLLQYMRMSEFTTDYWIGGRFDLDTNSWSWVTNDTPMPLGSPYWATRYNSFCTPRSPPHTDPFSDPAAALPGAPCYHYLQAPKQRKQGWCVALTYEHYYSFTDEECQKKRSPLCVYIDKSFEKAQEKTGNKTHH